MTGNRATPRRGQMRRHADQTGYTKRCEYDGLATANPGQTDAGAPANDDDLVALKQHLSPPDTNRVSPVA
jgi:hypothetical protein